MKDIASHTEVRVEHLPYHIDEAGNRDHFYETHWKRTALNLLKRHTPLQGRTYLDYGCGRGETLGLCRNEGLTATGADIDPECVRLSSAHGKAVLLDGDDPVRQFGEKSFDIVGCFHVLEHVESPVSTLRAFRAMARDYVLIAVPNLRQLTHMARRNTAPDLINTGHMCGWDHWHMRNMAERFGGLEFVDWGYDGTKIALLSNVIFKTAGRRTAIFFETRVFNRLFPLHCLSVIGLFKPVSSAPAAR